MVTSEWGTPDMFENGLVPELLLAEIDLLQVLAPVEIPEMQLVAVFPGEQLERASACRPGPPLSWRGPF
jgi:hypothetical protein